jgi:arabinofuranosyltransferase
VTQTTEAPIARDTPEAPVEEASPAAPSDRFAVLERVLTAGVVAVVLVLGWRHRWTTDDAFINFRVVDNLLAGNGPVFSAPERVEVATSPLWLFILAGADAVVPGSAAAWASVVLGLLLTATGVLFAMLGARRLFAATPKRLMVPFGAVVFAALPPTWDFTTSGLETGLAFGWIGLSFWGLVRWTQAEQPAAGRPVWLYVLIGLGPLVRPDFAIIAGLLLLWLTVVGAGRWWQRGLGLLAAAVLPVAYQIFRMGYYGLLVPNTAVAKESSRSLWGRGFTYLADLVAPHMLWVPALLTVVLLALVLPRVGWRRREWSLVAVVLLAAAVHGLYVVRVGGDFMHARLLMPSLFLALCPVASLPLSRARAWVSAALLAATAVWAGASAAVLRVDYVGHIGPSGFADERGVYVRKAGMPNPVTMADHGQAGLSAYGARLAQLDREGADIIAVGPTGPDAEADVLAPSSGGVVYSVGSAGFRGVAAGTDVFVLDYLGLTDPVASHLEAQAPGRPGHEKRFPAWYLLARYGAPELAEQTGGELPAPEMIADARAALSCGTAAELLAATNEPLTWDRFWDNLTGSFERTSMRIPLDPAAAEQQFC